jgi:hypothetical protein
MSDTPVSTSTPVSGARAMIVDVDGVISPVHGLTEWGDDVVAGNVFGPVLVPRARASLWRPSAIILGCRPLG